MRPFIALAIALAATPAAAQTVAAPRFTPGDSWTVSEFKEVRGRPGSSTRDIATVVSSNGSMLTIGVQPVDRPGGSAERLLNADWSRMRSVDGRQTVISRPLAFPMRVGSSWAVDYVEHTPADRRHSKEQWHKVYKVTGWEDVTVPAGTFHALRIECEGSWTAEFPANVTVLRASGPGGSVIGARRQGPRTIAGRSLDMFWYAPEVGRWVRSDEQVFDANDLQSEHEGSVLEAFTFANPVAPAADSPVAVAPAAPHAKHVRSHRPEPRVAVPAAHPMKPKPPSHPLPGLQETRTLALPAFRSA